MAKNEAQTTEEVFQNRPLYLRAGSAQQIAMHDQATALYSQTPQHTNGEPQLITTKDPDSGLYEFFMVRKQGEQYEVAPVVAGEVISIRGKDVTVPAPDDPALRQGSRAHMNRTFSMRAASRATGESTPPAQKSTPEVQLEMPKAEETPHTYTGKDGQQYSFQAPVNPEYSDDPGAHIGADGSVPLDFFATPKLLGLDESPDRTDTTQPPIDLGPEQNPHDIVSSGNVRGPCVLNQEFTSACKWDGGQSLEASADTPVTRHESKIDLALKQ